MLRFGQHDNSTVFLILLWSDMIYPPSPIKKNEKDNKIAKHSNVMLVPIKICERAYKQFIHVTVDFVFATE